MQGSKDLYVGSFYKPPDYTEKEYLEKLKLYLDKIPTQNGAHLWIGGDFNLADIDWESESTKPYPTNSAQCQELLTIAKNNYLDQVVTEPTRVTETCSNILDLFFTNNESLINQVHVIPGIADHEAVFIESSLRPLKKVTAPRKVSSKIYDKRDDFDFDIVNFPFLDGDVPRRASYGVYISQLIRFARVCNHVTDFNARNKCLTAKLLQQGYRYHKLRKTFSKFYRRHYELISKYNVGLKTLLSEGLSEPEFYGDLVYKFKKLKGINDFSFQFRKIITRYRRIGYNLNVMRQSACLVFNPIMVDNYAAFFNCTPLGRTSDSMMAPT